MTPLTSNLCTIEGFPLVADNKISRYKAMMIIHQQKNKFGYEQSHKPIYIIGWVISKLSLLSLNLHTSNIGCKWLQRSHKPRFTYFSTDSTTAKVWILLTNHVRLNLHTSNIACKLTWDDYFPLLLQLQGLTLRLYFYVGLLLPDSTCNIWYNPYGISVI